MTRKKKVVIGIVAGLGVIGAALLGLYLYYGRDHYDPSKYSTELDEGLAKGATVGFSLPDQHDKTVAIDASTKLLIVGLGQGPNRDIRKFLDGQPADLLSKQGALYLADISKAPVIIRNRAILPALKKLPYQVVLIYEKAIAEKLTPPKTTEGIVLVALSETKVESVSVASTAEMGKALGIR